MPRLRRFEREALIGLIYEAAVQPQLWTAVLERLSDVVGGGPANLTRLNATGTAGTGIVARADPAVIAAYAAYYAGINPRFSRRSGGPHAPAVYADEERLPRDALMRSEYFNDFERPMGWERSVVIGLGEQDGYVASMVLGRAERKGEYTAEDLKVLRGLQPHLIRAFGVTVRLAEQQQAVERLREALELTPHAMFLVDAAGRLGHANAAAVRLLAAGRGLRVDGGRLTADSPRAAQRLAAMVSVAGSRHVDVRSGGSMTVPSLQGAAPLNASVLPLSTADTFPLTSAECVLVSIRDPSDGGAAADAEPLRSLYGLTAAESRTALAIAEGLSPRQIAERSGLSVNTVRVHLTNIFSKTGAHRQGELVRLVLTAAGS